MKKRFIHIALISVSASLAVMLLLAIPLTLSVYFHDIQVELRGMLVLIASDEAQMEADPQGFAISRGDMLGSNERDIRLTILTPEGEVLADSHTADRYSEAGKDEISQAREEGWGFDIHKSARLGKYCYYVAYYNGSYIYRLSMEISQMARAMVVLCLSCIVGAFVGILVAGLLSKYFAKRSARDVHTLAKVAKKAASGDLTVRARMDEDSGELRDIGNAVNKMTKTLARRNKQLTAANDSLNAVLQGVKDGVVAVDGNDGGIIILTDHAREILGGDPQKGRTLDTVGPNYVYVRDAMLRARAENQPVECDVTIGSMPEKTVSIWAAPLEQDEGAIAVIEDVTRMRELERMRRDFVANVTHELKTPLTSIRGYIELLSSGKRDEQTARQFYEIIEIEAQRLANLIDDLLELSSIEQANTRPKAEPVSVADTVREVFEQVAPMAQKMEVALQSDIQEGLTVTMTHKHLQELVMNLTDNAVKYNRPGGRVTVHGRQEAGNIVISVSDTGIGIPPESVDRIFERFYRVDKGRSRELGGTGLGLSIVKHIAGLYGGSVRVDSTLGQGTAFTVCLPAEE
ncbi:MAG TPA: HAMP domain-containing protein [Candidatus Onthovicinus excrementipullorum]|nr:HAMP domain-containing protein [Candidatus Onthovicinus excrementipullorum]